MNKDELLKIYSAYLPYGLKIGFEGEEHEHSFVGLELSNEGVMLISPFGDFGRADIQKCKPILYDLSYLTKPIEHEGKDIIPIIELYKKANSKAKYGVLTSGIERTDKGQSYTFHVFEDGKHVFKLSTYTHGYGTFFLDNLMVINAYSLYQELLKLHFNFFNIPESEYINKATLTTNK